jgi:hypothetical protein
MPLNYPVIFKDWDASDNANIQTAVATAIADAESLWAPEKFDGVFPTRGFGIKRLQPKDIGRLQAMWSAAPAAFSDMWYFSYTTAGQWLTIIGQAVLSDSCYVILTGFFNYDANPDVEAIKIIADGIEYPVIDLQEMYGWDFATAYFSHPIIIRPEKMITVKMRCTAPGIKHFGFLGFVVAKRSYLIGEI